MTGLNDAAGNPSDAPLRPAGTPSATTLLSVCIPTYKRADGLEQALRSVTATPSVNAAAVEIVVSDNGGSDAATGISAPHLERWPGPTSHVVHDPPLGMVGNFNACWQLARGEWVFILHDDDYLIGARLDGLVQAASNAGPDEHALLLGVEVVDERGRRRRRQVPSRLERLNPSRAVEWLVSDSSSVRFPAMLVRRSAYEEVGGFDADMANMTDYDMWLRLFSRFGVTRVPETTAAYVVHSSAATEELFSPFGVALLEELFRRVEDTHLIDGRRLRQLKRDYLHKFLLAGTVRRIQRGQWARARETLRLFQEDPVAELGWSPRWAPLRLAAQAALTAAGPLLAERQPVHR